MPGLDYDVHPLTVGGARYGCHGKPRTREPIWVKAGYIPGSIIERKFSGMRMHIGGPVIQQTPVFVQIEDFGSLECRYDMSLTDPKCAECQHQGSGEAYNEEIRRRGT